MYNNYMCFTTLPKIYELLYVFVTISSHNDVTTSYYNQIILKCRQLIFEISNVIACPQTEGIYGIHIIFNEDFYRTGLLNKYLETHFLKKTGPPQAVQKFMYEEAYFYTITAKLAPKWNQVSNYLVRGKNFLTDTNTMDSLQLSICINEKGSTTLSLEISQIRLSKMSIDKLYLSKDEMKEYNENRQIYFKNSNTKTVRVLPSLKRGNVLSIIMEINEASSMNNYEQMRRHWKNTYGYRLPKIENNLFYMEVSFFDGSQVFTYPNLCLTPYEPTFVQRIEPAPIVTSFIVDLQKAMPTIFGEKYPVFSHISKPTVELLPALQVTLFPNSCKINTNLNRKTEPSSTNNSAIVYLPTKVKNQFNETGKETQSKLSQLLNELNKDKNKTNKIYLTHNSSTSNLENNNKNKENDKNSLNNEKKSFTADTQYQLNFLTKFREQYTKTEKPNEKYSNDSQKKTSESAKIIPKFYSTVKKSGNLNKNSTNVGKYSSKKVSTPKVPSNAGAKKADPKSSKNKCNVNKEKCSKNNKKSKTCTFNKTDESKETGKKKRTSVTSILETSAAKKSNRIE